MNKGAVMNRLLGPRPVSAHLIVGQQLEEKEGRVNLSYEDQEALRYAKALLENPGLAAKITGLIGMPIEMALQRLPEKWAQVVNEATKKSLETALTGRAADA